MSWTYNYAVLSTRNLSYFCDGPAADKMSPVAMNNKSAIPASESSR